MRRTDFGPNADLNYKELSKLMNKEAHKISGIFSKLDLDVKVDDVHDFCMPVGGHILLKGVREYMSKRPKILLSTISVQDMCLSSSLSRWNS